MPESGSVSQVNAASALAMARQFIRFSSDAMFIVGPEQEVVCWNQPIEHLTGFLSEYVQGKPLVKLFPSLASDQLVQALQLAFTGTEQNLGELEFELAGHLRLCQLKLFPLTPAAEGPGLVAGIVKALPLLEPGVAESLAVEAKEEWSSDAPLADAAPCIITIYDLEEGQHKYFNKQMELQMGFTLEEIRAYGPALFQELIHPDDVQQLREQIGIVATLPDGEAVELEYRIQNKEGVYRWFLVRGSVYSRNSQGQATQALAVLIDIQEHRISKLLLQSVLQTSQVGIMAFTACRNEQGQISDFLFSFLNQTASLLLNLDPEQVIGQSLYSLLKKAGSISCFEHYLAAMEQDAPVEFEYKYELENGDFWLATTAARMGDGLTVSFTNISNRKKTEEELSQSRSFIQKVTDALPVGLLVYDFAQRKPVFLNGAICHGLGLALEQLQELEWGELQQLLLHPECHYLIEERRKKLADVANGESVVNKLRLRQHNGTYRWCRLSDTVFSRDENGTPQLVLSVVQDVDDLKNSKDLLEGVVNSSASMILAFESVRNSGGEIVDFRYSLVNSVSEQFTSLPPQELIGQTLLQYMTDTDWNTRFTIYKQVVETGRDAQLEQHFELPKGTTWFTISVVKMGDGFVATFTDNTERKLAEQRLLESEHFIRKITDSTPQVISLFDFEKQEYLFLNRHIGELLGYTDGEMAAMGKHPGLQLIHPDDLVRAPEHHQRLASLPDGEVAEIEYRMREKNGEYRWMVARDTVFRRAADGSIGAILGVSQDIHEVKKSKDLLARVLDSSNSGITVFKAVRNQEGEITDFAYTLQNAAADAMLKGRVRKETLVQMWPNTSQPLLFENYKKVVETGQPLHQEYLYHEELGIWLDLTAIRLDDGLVVTFQDVTARKEAENQIRKNETLLTEAQQIAHIGIWDWDIRNDTITWSDTLHRMYGFEPGELDLKLDTYLNLLNPADKPQIQQAIAKAFETGEPFTVNHPVYLPNGTVRHVIGKGRLLSGADNQPLRMLGTTMDVTELIEMRRQLHEMEQLKMLDQTIPQIVWTASADGRATYVNQRWHTYTGTTDEQVLNSSWAAAIIHPDDRPAAATAWKEAMRNESEFEAEFRMRRHDGEYRWFLTRAVPVKDESGRLIKWFGTSTDIHDQKQTVEEMAMIQDALSHYNRELSRKNEELRKINSDLDNFIYTASHDLKAPISNIEGLLDLLRSEVEAESEVSGRIFDLMHKSISRFKNTLIDLSEISKVERSQQDDVALVHLPEVLDDIDSYIQQLVIESKAQIRLKLEVEDVHFSRKNIRSILYNLISNALKYRAADKVPQVLVQTRTIPEQGVELVVQDNGLGLDPNSKNRVFEMFRREHDHVEGSGVGLYIVKRIVENAGGTIELDTEKGKGSTFRVFLPQPQASEKQKEA